MNIEQYSMIPLESTTQYEQHSSTIVPLTLSICNSTKSLDYPSTKGRTTAAIIPSLKLPGVDVVIYEKVN